MEPQFIMPGSLVASGCDTQGSDVAPPRQRRRCASVVPKRGCDKDNVPVIYVRWAYATSIRTELVIHTLTRGNSCNLTKWFEYQINFTRLSIRDLKY